MDSNDLVFIPALKVGFCVWRRTSPVSDAIAKLLFVRFLPWTSSDHVTEHARLLSSQTGGNLFIHSVQSTFMIKDLCH